MIRRSSTAGRDFLKQMSTKALMDYTVLISSPQILTRLPGIGSRVPPTYNVIISNVPGPRGKLYFLGSEMEAYYPISALVPWPGAQHHGAELRRRPVFRLHRVRRQGAPPAASRRVHGRGDRRARAGFPARRRQEGGKARKAGKARKVGKARKAEGGKARKARKGGKAQEGLSRPCATSAPTRAAGPVRTSRRRAAAGAGTSTRRRCVPARGCRPRS